jgi:hypothetical protein
MRCKACNVELTNREIARQSSEGEYIDLCNTCYKHSLESVYDGLPTNFIESIDFLIET